MDIEVFRAASPPNARRYSDVLIKPNQRHGVRCASHALTVQARAH
jgi:hypothetical protein